MTEFENEKKELLGQLDEERGKNEDWQFKFEEAAIIKSDAEVNNNYYQTRQTSLFIHLTLLFIITAPYQCTKRKNRVFNCVFFIGVFFGCFSFHFLCLLLFDVKISVFQHFLLCVICYLFNF